MLNDINGYIPQQMYTLVRYVLLSVMVTITSCAMYAPISNEVRPGGTVMVMVDGVRHDMPQKTDLIAGFIDSAGGSHTFTVREVLRVNADPASLIGIGKSSGINVYQGQLLAIIDLPGPPIAVGEGVLTITNNYNAGAPVARTHDLKILPDDALPGSAFNPLSKVHGGPDPWNIFGIISVGTLPHVLLKTDVDLAVYDDANIDVAGVSFTLKIDNVEWINASGQYLGVTKMVQDPNLQLAWGMQDNGNGTTNITIHLSNPNGFQKEGASNFEKAGVIRQSLFDDLSSVALVWLAGDIPWYTGTDDNPFDLVSYTYYDINGDTVDGLSVDPQRRY